MALVLLAARPAAAQSQPGRPAVPRHRRRRSGNRADERAAAQPGQAPHAGPGRAADRAVPADARGRGDRRLAAGGARCSTRQADGTTAGSASVRITLGLWAGPAVLAAALCGCRSSVTARCPMTRARRGRPVGDAGDGAASGCAGDGPQRAGMAGHAVHGPAEPVVLRHFVLVPDHVPGSRASAPCTRATCSR